MSNKKKQTFTVTKEKFIRFSQRFNSIMSLVMDYLDEYEI